MRLKEREVEKKHRVDNKVVKMIEYGKRQKYIWLAQLCWLMCTVAVKAHINSEVNVRWEKEKTNVKKTRTRDVKQNQRGDKVSITLVPVGLLFKYKATVAWMWM